MSLSNHKPQVMHYLSVDTFRWSTWREIYPTPTYPHPPLPLPTPTHPYPYLPPPTPTPTHPYPYLPPPTPTPTPTPPTPTTTHPYPYLPPPIPTPTHIYYYHYPKLLEPLPTPTYSFKPLQPTFIWRDDQNEGSQPYTSIKATHFASYLDEIFMYLLQTFTTHFHLTRRSKWGVTTLYYH